MVVVMILPTFVQRFMRRVYVAVLHPGGKKLQDELQEKAGQHQQPYPMRITRPLEQFGQQVSNGNCKQVCAGKNQQQTVGLTLLLR